MPLHEETRAGGCVHILCDENGRIVRNAVVKNGFVSYLSDTGEVLEQHPIVPPRRWICTACGYRCEVAGFTDHPGTCGKQSNWIEIQTTKTEV